MEKIKQFIENEKGKDILIVIIVILVGLISFELGRLSKGNTSSGIKIEHSNELQGQEAAAILSENSLSASSDTTATQNSVGKNFFASSRGTKYYPLGCSAGKTLKQENRVYFATREDAEKAGYALSSSCK